MNSILRLAMALLLVALATSPIATAQSPSISGIINRYTPVVAIDSCSRLTVDSAAGFRAGDTVLIIQMMGAAADTTSGLAAGYGAITSYGNAGNYELGIIEAIDENRIALRDLLLRRYDPAGRVQLVRVPRYGDVTIAGTLTAPAWNGRTGGVIIFDASGTVTLGADINAAGLGFGGGRTTNVGYNQFNGLFCTIASGGGAAKGGGIAAKDADHEGARGAYGNGGGGGNAHNAGGGGGGNGGRGGQGGNQYNGLGSVDIGGLGGYPLGYGESLRTIFLGGGGGAGHQNDRTGTAGVAGGGIVIIRAATLIGNGKAIIADGRSTPDTSGNDGAGGGGAGGTVLLEVGSITKLTVRARGGNGGNVMNARGGSCHGTGGGGAGGVLWTTTPAALGGITVDTDGGIPGIETNRESPCVGSTYGGRPGEKGITLLNLAIPQGRMPRRVDAGADATICAGTGTTIRAIGAPEATYSWSPSEGLACDSCAETIAAPLRQTTYMVTATLPNGCISTDTVVVRVLPSPVADAGPDRALCPGEEAILVASPPGMLYRWTPAVGLSCDDCQSPTASPATTTVYTLTVINASGCGDSAQVTVTVHPPPDATITADTTICAGEPLALSASGGAVYSWSPDEGLSCTDCPNPIARPARTTTYPLEMTDANGCHRADSVLVTVLSVTADAAGDTTLCAGQATTISASGGTIYRWSPEEGLSCADCPNPTASPAASTRYTVMVANDRGCVASDSVMITILSPVIADAGPDVWLCLGDSVGLVASGGVAYGWSPAEGLSCTDCRSPMAAPSATTLYRVSVTGENGCRGEDSMLVTVTSMRTVRAHIGREHAGAPGRSIIMPVVLDDSLDAHDVGTFEIEIGYRPELLRVEGMMAGDTLTAGWRIDTLNSDRSPGRYRVRLSPPGGERLKGTGTLAKIMATAFIGPYDTTELPLAISIPNLYCAEIVPAPGRFALDSLCGLSYRLMEWGAGSYALDGTSPNPFNPSTTIRFSLGLERPTTIDIYDARGGHCATLLDAVMPAGWHTVTWDASAYPSGIFYYRIRSGSWSERGAMILTK